MAFVGGGGKTSAIIRLTRELSDRGWRVLASTTTRVGRSMSSELPTVLQGGEGAADELLRALEAGGRAFLAGGIESSGKFTGIAPGAFGNLARELRLDAILVEADGSRQRPLKAPAEHEPVLPPDADLVVPVAGLDSLGLRLNSRVAHRPELIAAIHPSRLVTPELVASLVTSADGGLKSVPEEALVRPLLNKSREAGRGDVERTARLLLRAGEGRLDRVVVSDLAAGEFGYLEAS